MIDDILTYIDTYEEIRGLTGLNKQELPDTTLSLLIYRNELGRRLEETSGVYPLDYTEGARTLKVLFDEIDSEDDLIPAIQTYSMYVVAATVMKSVGMRGYKSITDGKSSITRFSPESTYKDTFTSILQGLGDSRMAILDLFGEEGINVTDSFLAAIPPDVDLVTGE